MTSAITLDKIKARCVEEGDCLIWQGGVSKEGYPIMKHGGACLHVRRVAIALDGREPKRRQPVTCSCGDKRCIQPRHLKLSTYSKIGKATAATGVYAAKARCAKVAHANRNRADTKLTMEIAREIRASTESSEALAARYGVYRSRINAVRRGDAWKEYAATPFAGLGARA